MSAETGTPDDDEEPVGTSLAKMRRARGLTGAALAALVGMSQPKISRIERGKGLAEPADIAALARALGADDDQVALLMEHAERSHDRMTDWRPTSTNLATRQTTMGDWESAAAVMREFEPAAVPGLLQSSGYARAILEGVQRFIVGAPEAEPVVLAAVAERMRRQQMIADATKSFHFILAEAALRNEVCAPAEMLAQINRLGEIAARQANISIGILPDGVRLEIPPVHGFVILDESMVVIDLYNTGILTRGRRDVESYRRVFDLFDANAVRPEEFLEKYESYHLDRLRARRSGA